MVMLFVIMILALAVNQSNYITTVLFFYCHHQSIIIFCRTDPSPPCSGSAELRRCGGCSSRRPCPWPGCSSGASHTPGVGGRWASLGRAWRSIGTPDARGRASDDKLVMISKELKNKKRRKDVLEMHLGYLQRVKYTQGF